MTRAARLTALAALCLVTVVLLLPAAISVSTGGAVPGFIGEFGRWLWPAVGVMILVSVGLALWERGRGHETSNRTAALARVESRVKALLAASLAAQTQIKLGVLKQPAISVRVDGEEVSSRDLEAVYDRLGHTMVLVGPVGSGRSTLLRELCLTLVERARNDPQAPIPVVVDLATWRAYGARKPTEFTAWLLREMNRRYGISRSAGTIWLRRERVAVLIDGLDEVPRVDRALCESELAPFASVVSSTSPIDNLPSVFVEPLTRGQVLEYIASVSPRLDSLESALTPEIWERLDSPLALNLLALTHLDKQVDTIGNDFVGSFVVERLSGQRGAGPTIRALKFLARLGRPDLGAPVHMPHRRAWLPLLPTRPLWLLFVRAVPAVYAGGVCAVSFMTALRLGLWPALVFVVAASSLLVLVNKVPRVFHPPGRAHGIVTAALGFLAGVIGGLLVGLAGFWLGAVGTPWPYFVAYVFVVVASFFLALGFIPGDAPVPWALLIAAAPGVSMFWTGPYAVLAGMGVGFSAGVAGGIFAAAVGRVWRTVRPVQQQRMRQGRPWWVQPAVPVLGTVGLLGGIGALGSWGTALGVALGLLVTPTAARDYVWPFDALAEVAAEGITRPLSLGELSFRRKALLHLAQDRLLLTRVDGEYRFVHVALRDHLASCDPTALVRATRR
ncbi:NACHT domain-containing protein [Lentzea sp. BCCO 10_0798]|uniref:NACHT domain-containing protein n=1 Tax=Lentzea kristufekii TaxID=3095430 RepID=A0ABU4TI57_9PSEU|nr:NACHT domain-containing protein [Lentzea sp. BCCO 10_0798]MDX8047944.1 NACHT domain-containing protein [Lentzea sp. BCCO 10_0798]